MSLTNGRESRPWDAGKKAPRVLFIDDDAICRRHFEVLLGARQIVVDLAASADEAIGFARRHQYRVIVSDLMMPRLDGLAVIQRIRPTQNDARFLVTTGLEPARARTVLRNGQVDGVLWKPWEVGSLMAVIEHLVTRPEKTPTLEPIPMVDVGGTILIIDDSPYDAHRLTALLHAGLGQDVAITVVGSFADAVAYVTSDAARPAIVLLDLHLPDTDGLKAVARLSELGLEAPVIVLGDSHDEAVAVQAVQAGAQDYLVREFADERRLARTIRQAAYRNDSNQRLTRVALYDQLTGAANRVLFERRMEQAILAARAQGTKLSVLFADLDRFKSINDQFGHDVGDSLLAAFAMRIGDCLQASDLLCRLGGDEFAVLSTRVQSREEAAALAESLREGMRAPFELSGHVLQATASIGYALFPDDGVNEKELMRSADVAMYQAKGRKRRSGGTAEGDASERMRMIDALRPALERCEFVLHYQPIVQLSTRQPVGVEVLLRWQRTQERLLFPAAFLSVLDESGMIIPVGRWVIREACREAQRFRALTGSNLFMSVNCTATQIADRSFVHDVLDTLAQRSTDAHGMQIELSELALAPRSEAIAESLRELRAAGVRTCLDDFGSGTSSLTELRRAHLSSVKVDRTLVHELATSEEARATVMAIIALARGLHLQVVAEGVETEAQHEQLVALGCEHGQGNLYGSPLPSDALCERLPRTDGSVPG